MDEYLVPTGFGEDEFIEKKSRFIGRLWPVETEEAALEKISFHSIPKERQCQRMFKLPHNYTHLTQFSSVQFSCSVVSDIL